MANQYFGWLYGLTGSREISLNTAGIQIRPMSQAERDAIIARSADFWVTKKDIWQNTTERFPFLYEMEGSENAMGEALNAIAVLLNLLSDGEVQTPIHWTSSGASSSSSDIASLFFRFINSRLKTISIDQLSDVFSFAVQKLPRQFFSTSREAIGPVLLDRFLSTKLNPIPDNAHPGFSQQIVARAADIGMTMEYILQDRTSTEVGFRLGMSLAWLLGGDFDERSAIKKVTSDNYSLRSTRVHGSKTSWKPNEVEKNLATLNAADCLLRRLLLARLVADVDDVAWQRLFSSARLGHLPENFDQVRWLT